MGFQTAHCDLNRRDRLLLDAEGLLRERARRGDVFALRPEAIDRGEAVPPRRLHALNVPQHPRHRLLRGLQLVLHLRALLPEFRPEPLRLLKHLHVDQPRATRVLVPTADRTAVRHAVALHGDAVEVSAPRVLHRDVEVPADEHVAEQFVKRRAEFVVEANLAQHREHVLGVRVLARAVLQTVQGQERHSSSLLLVQVLDDLRRDVVVIDDDVEQLVRHGRLDRGEEPLVALHELDEGTVHALDAVVLRDPLHRRQPAEELARHRELKLLIASLHLVRLGRDFRVELRVPPLQLLAFVLSLVPRRDLRLVLPVRRLKRGLLLRELRFDARRVLLVRVDALTEFVDVLFKDINLVRFPCERALAVLHLRLQPLVALLLRRELRCAALLLVQHLQTAVHLRDLRRGCFLASRLCVHLRLDRVNLRPRLRDLLVQLRLVPLHELQRFVARGELLPELLHVEVRGGLLLHRDPELDVRG